MFENVKCYQEGRVTKEVICNWHCELPMSERQEVFSYIKLIDEDGTEHFVYEDQEMFDKFEKDFHENRFTSYHDLLTTTNRLTEDRGFIQLDYYERRPRDVYHCMSLEEARRALEGKERVAEAISKWGDYKDRVE